MRLTSEAFDDGGLIPESFTCDGADRSPPLAWRDAPNGTKSFVLLVDDMDAPGGVFHHWACFDIPADSDCLPEGASEDGSLRQGVNGFGQNGYGGPCPPHGHGLHRYRFRLLALHCRTLPVGEGARCTEVEAEANKRILAEARITGRFYRR